MYNYNNGYKEYPKDFFISFKTMIKKFLCFNPKYRIDAYEAMELDFFDEK